MGGAASSSRVHIRNSQEEELLETKASNGKAKRDINDVSKQDNNKATRKALASKNTAKEQNGLSSESETTILKLEEETEVNTDEVLKSRGFDDPVLATYCKETPTLLNSFIKIYEHVENIKDKLEEEDVISAVNKYFKGISLAYSGKKSFRIIKGNFLAEIGFADVYKDVIDRLLPKYPNMLTLIKLESDDDKVEKMENNNEAQKPGESEKPPNTSENEKNTSENEHNTSETKKATNEAEKRENNNEAQKPGESEKPPNTSENEKNTSENEKITSENEHNTSETKQATNEAEKQNSPTEEEQANVELRRSRTFLVLLSKISINFTDLCDDMCIAFSKAGLVPIWVNMVEQLKESTEYHLRWMDSNGHLAKKTQRGIILSLCLGTLHNVSRRVPARNKFHGCNAVAVLVPLLEDPVVFFATKALLILAYLIDESNDNLIKSKEEPIKLIIRFIEKAINSKNKRYLGFSSCEIANGLAQIAINDNNKKLIVTNGALPVLMSMIEKANDDEERTEAVNALWILAFDDDNRIKMKETEGLIELLHTMKDSTNKDQRKAVNGALWQLEGKQNHSVEDTHGDIGNQSSSENHIMISYQWDVQKTLIQVKNKLQSAGFKVWMDLEQMGGSTLEAMANAVENSAVVIVCVSQKYKESSNCRSEAEYAFQLKKNIVPLMMEKNYRPNGWLGMIMGSKLWIDFTHGQKRLDASVKDLVKELGSRGKQGGNHVVKAINVDTVDAVPDQPPKIDISGWTNKDVMAWIQTFGLEKKEENTLHKLTGTMLILLNTLRSESPDYYYSSLKDDIGLLDVHSVLKFTHELEKLVG